jgi:hypothetical protein
MRRSAWRIDDFRALIDLHQCGLKNRRMPRDIVARGDHLTRAAGRCWRQVARLSKLSINPLLNSVGSEAHETSLGLAGGDSLSDLEAPLPQARFDLHEGKINALAVHDVALGKNASFASSSASSFESTSRSDSLHASARRFLKRAGFSQ